MYLLQYLMMENDVSPREIAKTIGKTDRSVRNKLAGRQEFTIAEGKAIQATHFPAETLDSLFSIISE